MGPREFRLWAFGDAHVGFSQSEFGGKEGGPAFDWNIAINVEDICGNHDRSGLDQPEAWWFQKWLDPLGVNTFYQGVQCYLHTSEYAPQGWYGKAELTLTLDKDFR
jgi:hypothetical protein